MDQNLKEFLLRLVKELRNCDHFGAANSIIEAIRLTEYEWTKRGESIQDPSEERERD